MDATAWSFPQGCSSCRYSNQCLVDGCLDVYTAERLCVSNADRGVVPVSDAAIKLLDESNSTILRNNDRQHLGIELTKSIDRTVPRAHSCRSLEQAMGSYEGGRMLFLGLGTGLGSAFIAQNAIVTLELGKLSFSDGTTLGEMLGRRGYRRMGKKAWRDAVVQSQRASLEYRGEGVKIFSFRLSDLRLPTSTPASVSVAGRSAGRGDCGRPARVPRPAER
jgi:hypothetical protein